MNEIRRRGREDEEIARIREIVGRHALPDFVTGFDVRLGEFDGEPSVWIIFKTLPGFHPTRENLPERVYAIRALKDEVHHDLLENIEGRYPYYRFQQVEPAS